MKFDCPQDYPEELIPTDNLLGAQQLTFGLFKKIMRLAQTKLKSRSWNEANITAYC